MPQADPVEQVVDINYIACLPSTRSGLIEAAASLSATSNEQTGTCNWVFLALNL